MLSGEFVEFMISSTQEIWGVIVMQQESNQRNAPKGRGGLTPPRPLEPHILVLRGLHLGRPDRAESTGFARGAPACRSGHAGVYTPFGGNPWPRQTSLSVAAPGRNPRPVFYPRSKLRPRACLRQNTHLTRRVSAQRSGCGGSKGRGDDEFPLRLGELLSLFLVSLQERAP